MDDITHQQAMILFDRAQREQMKGNFSEAIALYKRSLEVCPTAEAYTFLGWTYGMLNRYEDAIEMCKQAILVDPEYGNPYNDIGSYLLELEEVDEALEWLEKATEVARYDEPQFPYVNMGKAYEMQGKYRSALQAYDKALALDPFYTPAHLMKYSLIGKMN